MIRKSEFFLRKNAVVAAFALALYSGRTETAAFTEIIPPTGSQPASHHLVTGCMDSDVREI